MLNRSCVLGVDHKKTPVNIRERLSGVSLDALKSSLPQVSELMLLSTCNRFEIYAALEDESHQHHVVSELAKHAGLEKESLEDVLYHKRGEDMLRHGFRVAASLESMVLGEPQILGQMKQAYSTAKTAGKVHGFMDRFCTTAFRVGKRARTETGLGKSSVSVASQAVNLITNRLQGQGTVLVVGAGDMVKSALTHLNRYPNIHVALCNRTFSKAKELAGFFSRVSPVCFEGLTAHLATCDAVLTSTSAQEPIFKPEMFNGMQKENPLIMVDIAMPRDIDVNVNALNNVEVYDIDRLGQEVEKNRIARESQVNLVHDIIEEEVQSFVDWTVERKNVHMIERMRDHMEILRKEVIGKHASKEAEEATRLLMNKILHHPSAVLRAGNTSPEAMETALEVLFGVSCPRVRLLPIRGKSDTKSECPFMESLQK